jgi:hypothetical protein
MTAITEMRRKMENRRMREGIEACRRNKLRNDKKKVR